MPSRTAPALALAFPLGAALLAGCPKDSTPEDAATAADAPWVERAAADGLVVVEIDLSGDGAPDVYNYYRERSQAARLLVRKELDLNRDGRVDVWSFYDDTGVLTREERDSDFDGRVDNIDHYKGGRRVFSEQDSNFDGRTDVWKYYEGTQVRRKEHDQSGDGRVDFWEYFNDNGVVAKTGRDLDGDGQMDERSEYE